MSIRLACASHSPLLEFPGRVTPEVRAARRALAHRAEAIREFDPELVILFGTDHYGGQQMSCMPCFCVARSATALDDVGGTPGRLDVPAEIAVPLLDHVRRSGIDAAWSHEMEVDHGFSQALQLLCGGVASYPVLPIFINAIAPPFVPFDRSRHLGEAVGTWARSLDIRILLVGTGGLSHHPEIFFPPIDRAPTNYRPYLTFGERQSDLSRSEWMACVEKAHRDIAPHLAADDIPLEALHIHEDFDRDLLGVLCSEEPEQTDCWEPMEIAAQRGLGTMEIHSWIAGCAAARAGGAPAPFVDFYAPIREFGVGFGVLHAGDEGDL